jgi:hypothetical protein
MKPLGRRPVRGYETYFTGSIANRGLLFSQQRTVRLELYRLPQTDLRNVPDG